MNIYRSSTTMQMDAKYKAVKQSRCKTRVITALRSPINKTVSSRCDVKPGSLTGDAVQFSVGRLIGHLAARKATVPVLHGVRDALLAQPRPAGARLGTSPSPRTFNPTEVVRNLD